MKTKHFLITAEDSSLVAVVSASTITELEDKARDASLEQTGRYILGFHLEYEKAIFIDGSRERFPCFKDSEGDLLYAQLIEIY